MAKIKKIFKDIISDFSTLSLIISNLIIIFWAITQKWDLVTLMWIYWWQSVIIGFFNVIKILTLKNFSNEGVVYYRRQPSGAHAEIFEKILVTICFVFRFGLFHLLYALAIFLFIMNGLSSAYSVSFDNVISPNSHCVFYGIIIFFINHLFSFFYNRKKDTGKQNIGRVMMFPFIRTIPMQLTIMFAFIVIIKFNYNMQLALVNIQLVLILFLFLKLIIDIVTHLIEHKIINLNIFRKIKIKIGYF